MKPLEKFDYVHELDRITNSILNRCVEASKDGHVGELKFAEYKQTLVMPSRTILRAEWRRMKGVYVGMVKKKTWVEEEIKVSKSIRHAHGLVQMTPGKHRKVEWRSRNEVNCHV